MPRPKILALFFFLIPFQAALAADPPELEKLVHEWLDLRRELGQVKADWEFQKELLQGERDLLEAQKRQLIEDSDSQRRRAESLEAELARAREEANRDAAILRKLIPALMEAEKYIASWLKKLPAFMAAPALENFKRDPQEEVPENLSDSAQRLRRVFGLYSHLEQLNCSIHAEKILLRVEEREQEMDALFIGMAVGFAVSQDDSIGAAGRLEKEGWNWTWDPNLAAPIRLAWSCYQKEKSACFVEIPLQIEGSSE